MNVYVEMLVDAKLIMRDGLGRINPQVRLDSAGYTESWEQNLLPGIAPAGVEADLAGKGGSELDKKFRAAHSSAALAVNAFSWFRDHGRQVPIPGLGTFKLEGFERLFPTGLRGRSPHLDLVLRNGDMLVAIESKCLEYFSSSSAVFAQSYLDDIVDDRRSSPWFSEMLRLRGNPQRYELLNAAQLVKHAFGLSWVRKGDPTVLLYLFWEPDDAGAHALFQEHRLELGRFATTVDGEQPVFRYMSYQEMWNEWAATDSEPLRDYARLLQLRYCGRLGTYEGYTLVNGRKTDAGFWDDIDL